MSHSYNLITYNFIITIKNVIALNDECLYFGMLSYLAFFSSYFASKMEYLSDHIEYLYKLTTVYSLFKNGQHTSIFLVFLHLKIRKKKTDYHIWSSVL